MQPRTLDHVAFWVADREPIARYAEEHLGMHAIAREDTFTLLGRDARRGKLTLFDAEGPREQGTLKHVGLRVSDLVALWSAAPEVTAREYEQYGFALAGEKRVEVGGAYVEFHEGAPGEPERPLLNHLAVLVDSAEDVISDAGDLGIEVESVVDAANTYAAFLWGPERVRIEYVEHKPTFSLK